MTLESLILTAFPCRNLILGLMFARHGIFVNFSRVDPTLLEADAYSRIKFRDSETFCHGLMSGVVSASAIISPFQVTGHLGKYNQHRITLVPFGQEMRRDTSVWGQVLNFTVILATTSKTGFSFVTRGDNQPPSKFAAACKLFHMDAFKFALSYNVVLFKMGLQSLRPLQQRRPRVVSSLLDPLRRLSRVTV